MKSEILMYSHFRFTLNKFKEPVFAFQYFQAIRYLVSILISVIMVRCGLSGADLGHYEFWIFVVTALTFFWSAGIKNAILSYYPGLDIVSGQRLIFNVFILLFLVSLIFGFVILLFPDFLISFFADVGKMPFAAYVALYLVLSVPVVLTENILYLRHDANSLIRYTHWSQLSLLFLFAIVGYCSPLLSSFLLVLVISAFIRFCYLCYLLLSVSQVTPDWKSLRIFLIFSLPLILNMLLGSVMDLIDGWFVSRYFDISYFPVFRYGARELPFSTILFSSLSAAMIPVLIREGKDSYALKTRANRLMHILFPLSLLCMIISPSLFPLVYSDIFKESAFIFNIYLLILTSRVLMPQAFNFALHQHKIIIWSGILEIIANIILSFWWMQIWGVYGLALATVASYFVQKIILIYYNYRFNGITLSHYIDVRSYLGYCFASILVFIITIKFLS